jgi:hypothetical protein
MGLAAAIFSDDDIQTLGKSQIRFGKGGEVTQTHFL